MPAPGAPADAQPSAPGLPAEALAKAGGPFAQTRRHRRQRELRRSRRRHLHVRHRPGSAGGIPVRWSTVVLAGDGAALFTLSLRSAYGRQPRPRSTSRGARGHGHRRCRRKPVHWTAGGRRSPERRAIRRGRAAWRAGGCKAAPACWRTRWCDAATGVLPRRAAPRLAWSATSAGNRVRCSSRCATRTRWSVSEAAYGIVVSFRDRTTSNCSSLR